MLDTLRKGAQGWVAKALMGLLVVSFAVWGVEGIMTRSTATDVVAGVGEQEIHAPQFQRELDYQLRQFSQQLGQPLTPAMAAQFGLDRQVLQRLIAVAAIDEEARLLGLEVSEKDVAQAVVNDPELRVGNSFDRVAFNTMLQRMEMSEKMFLAERRSQMVREQLFSAVQNGVTPPRVLTDAIFKYQDELRTAAYVILPETAAGTIADPDEKALEEYYKAQSARFTVPETRSFSVMTLAPADLASAIVIPEEELQQAFKERHAEFDIPEKRDVVQIPFATKEEADKALTRLRSGTPADNIAEERGLAASDIQLGQVTRKDMLSPAIADAAFSLKANEFSEPVQGPLGFVILNVKQITPGTLRSYETVKDDLRKTIAEERARSQIYDVQNGIEDQRAGGASLEEIAQKDNLKIAKFEGVTSRGTGIDGKPIANLPAYAKLVENVYASEIGDQAPPGDTGNGGYYWIRVDDVKASFVKPLAEVRAEAIAAWKEDQRREKLVALAKSLADRGNKGEKIEALAAEVKGKVSVSEPMRRFTGTDVFSRNALTALFSEPEGGFAIGPTGKDNGILLMQARKVENMAAEPTLPQYQQLEAQLKQGIQDDLLSTMAISLQKIHGVTINEANLQKLTAAPAQ